MPSSKARPRATAKSVYIALLRGVNVGGKNMLPMADLADLFAASGCADVRTYIQSGNVVFAAGAACAQRISREAGRRIHERFGFSPVIVVRSAADLAAVAEGNPFLAGRGGGADTAPLHVAFLAEMPDPTRVGALDASRSPGDRFEVRGREIYLHLHTGVGRTRLTNAYFDSALATTSTIRNWRTVLTLLEMARAPAS